MDEAVRVSCVSQGTYLLPLLTQEGLWQWHLELPLWSHETGQFDVVLVCPPLSAK